VGYFYYQFAGNGLNNRESILQDMYGNKLSDSTNLLNTASNYTSRSLDWDLDYKKEFKKEGQELDISYNSSIGTDFNHYIQAIENVPSDMATSGSYANNPDMSRSTTVGIDYTHPVNDSLSFEAGAKAEYYNVNSTSDVYLLSPENNTYAYSTTESNSLTYQTGVYAAYASCSFRMFRWLDVKLGYRDEYTMTTANFSQVGNVNIPSYNTPIPSILIAHKLKNNQMLKLGYSHRIERPDAGDLNPFFNASDPQNVTTGNPYLKPELGNKIEFSYSKTFDKGSNLFITLFYRGNIDDIQPYVTYYPSLKIGDSTYSNVAVTTRSNIGSEDNYGINVYGSVPVTKKLNIRGNLSGFQRYINTGLSTGGNISGFNYRTNVNVTYDISSSFTAEAFSNYSSPRINAQGTIPSFTSYSFALRKQLFKKKGSIAITATNAFSKYVVQVTNLTGQNFTMVSTRQVPYQSFGFNFTYKFGKLEFKEDKTPDNSNSDPQGGGN
ncbi:MAG TPA: outer membrane beta-barrel family protein, partial [Bacteroidia bacterium]|nr:outer membrane beta-barrel family protein [Bacteroidia bacterium]